MGGSLSIKKGRKEDKHLPCRSLRNLLSHYSVLLYQEEEMFTRAGPTQRCRFCLQYPLWKAVLPGQSSAKPDCEHQNVNICSYLTDLYNFLSVNGEKEREHHSETVGSCVIIHMLMYQVLILHLAVGAQVREVLLW